MPGKKAARVIAAWICAPKGLETSAQGFNPGNHPPKATRPAWAPDRSPKEV